MKHQSWVRAVAVGAAAFAIASSYAHSTGATRVEVSPDGLEQAEIRPSPTDGLVTRTRDAAPYGTTPDWSNTLRRQVGGLQVVDMNGDGLKDLVVGVYNTSSFPPYTDWHNLIYYNTGIGLEQNPSWISSDQVSTSDVQVGLLNADAYPDIFAANGAGLADNVIYYGGPTGPDVTPDWISNEPVNCWTNAATLFDYDHDGDLDIITGNQAVSPDPYRPLYGFRNNAGVVSTVPNWSSAELSIQGGVDFGDYDHDGWEDLAVSKWSGFESGIYKNVNGVLQTTPIWTTGDTGTDRGALFADFNGDTWLDLVIGHNPPRVYTNNNGVFSLTWTAGTNSSAPQDMRVGDVDFDGDPDLIEIQFSTGLVRIHLNINGVLESVPSWTFDSPGAGSALALGDINNDGYADLVVGNAGEPSIFVFYATPPAVCAGDVNCDGVVNFSDIDLFVEALSYPGGTGWPYPDCPWLSADAGGDGDVTFADIDAFVALIGSTCP